MKRLFLAAALVGSLVVPGRALTSALTTPIYSGVVSSSQNVIIDMNAARIDYLSATASYSTASLTNVTFVDGAKSTATINFTNNTDFAAEVATNTLTVSISSALVPTVGNTVVTIASSIVAALNGSSVTINGVTLANPNKWVTGISSNTSAANLAAAINAYIPNVTAIQPPNADSFTITCANVGSFCNSYTIQVTTTAIAVGSTTLSVVNFTGGNDNPSFTITFPGLFNPTENNNYQPVNLTLTQGIQWTTDVNFASNTAVSVANAFRSVPTLFYASTTSVNTVSVYSASSGTVFNNYTLTTSTGALKAGKATFFGGLDAAAFNIQGINKVANVDWLVGANAAASAINAMNAINADPFLSTIVVATATVGGNGVVYATATSLGSNPYTLNSSTFSLTVSSNVFLGGLASAVNTTLGQINVAAHGYATGTPVLLTTTTITGTNAFPGLLAWTTYYAVVVDANNLKFATTYANATAVPPVTVGISTQAPSGQDVFKIIPEPISGILGLSWLASDDDVNFNTLTLPNNVLVSSVTLTAVGSPGSTYWDFGQINARYLELKIGGPNQGAYNLTVTPYGKTQANGY